MASLPSDDLSRPAASAAWVTALPTWPLWVGLAAFARLLAQPLALLNDPDTYLHIAAGKWIAIHHALPTADAFSHTMPGAAWVPGEWLAEFILAAIYGSAGWTGTVIVGATCFAVTMALLCHFLTRRIGPLPAVIATLAGAALVLPHTVVRPHLFAMPLLVLWAGGLAAARDDDRAPPWTLLPVMVLWANLHASFLFGLGVATWLGMEAILAAPAGRRRDTAMRWGGFVALAAAAGMLTPNGVTGFLQPWRLMAMPALQASFGEWLPPDLYEFPALGLWLAAFGGAGFALGVRVRLPRLGLVLLLVYMALSHVRHADLLGLVGPLLLAGAFAEALVQHGAALSGLSLWRAATNFAGPMRVSGIGISLILAGAMALPLLATPLARGDDRVTPAAALAESRHLGLRGLVFNSEAFGGYLAFAGVADFIDGRVEMFGNDFLAADVAAESGDAAALSRLLDRYKVGWTLLVPEAGAVGVLDRMPGWRRVYADAYAVIHIRVSEGGN